jgi:hypothetical protein
VVGALRHLRIHLVLLESFERRSVHNKLDIDLVRGTFCVEVLVDERRGVFRHIRILSIDVVQHLHFYLFFGSLNLPFSPILQHCGRSLNSFISSIPRQGTDRIH